MAEFNLARLRIELKRDPLARGYAGMSNAQVAAGLNAANRTVQKRSLSGDEVFQATDSGEWAALSATKRLEWLTFCGRASIDPFGAANVALVQELFAGLSGDTIANLVSLRSETISRGAELGAVGTFTAADVARIRGA